MIHTVSDGSDTGKKRARLSFSLMATVFEVERCLPTGKVHGYRVLIVGD